ncbi:hypothetical protein [Clostridium sp. AWRP]|uniref:hypothetical protein n=1 Tax=Clostridium sp. AWRP TaxID=2212991 RepID=UPI000FDA2CB5|nr:hypothetical protein [Clostridium sp. AWRP]AZV57913.1 hypothetical protein DMR38_15585 [Clostridium sp. AWRP]
MDYSKTLWKDHIKDQNGNVIQQGTPVSAQHLNNIENGLATAVEEINNNVGMIRETIPSGFTTLSDLDYGYMATNPNQIRLSSDSVAFVNGYKVTIPAGTIIQLDTPPTYDPVAKTGVASRDDLVFLEVWKMPVTDTGGEKINWRIRVVDGVDFDKVYHSGNTTDKFLGWDDPSHCSNITMQGGNISPTSIDFRNVFRNANISIGDFKGIDDAGLWLWYPSSDWEIPDAKDYSRTVDGYVYAIPMFKVNRRNSGGYSVNNGNGSILCSFININKNNQVIGDTVISLTGNNNVPSVEGIFIGDTVRFYRYDNPKDYFIRTITAIDTINKTVTLNTGIPENMTAGCYFMVKETLRPDLLYADIVDDRDILDLRHQVSLTGFNYQELLEENFDKLLRGELQTKERTKMLKTYHGISKTPIDANTVFYASFDGTTTAEVGNTPTIIGSPSFKSGLTGLGVKVNQNNRLEYSLNLDTALTYTIDFILNMHDNTLYNNYIFIACANNSLINLFSLMQRADNTIMLYYTDSLNMDFIIDNNKENHIRIIRKATSANIYVNGKFIGSLTGLPALASGENTLKIGSSSSDVTPIISDLSISNIDRGSTFATLPQDFIDGYARIAPAFNSQRNVFSDALTTETKQELIDVSGTGNKSYIKLGDVTDWIKDDSTKWNAGDKIKLDTLTGEIITGVIDTDTAIAKIIKYVPTVTSGSFNINVDDISKLSVGDTLHEIQANGTDYNQTYTITAIDTTNNIITVTSNIYPLYLSAGDLLFETTPSSSSPLVKFNATGTAQAGGANTITLPSTFSTTDDAYNGLVISVDSGTGAGQQKTITDYVGSTKVATVDSNWTIEPDNTSVITIHNIDVDGTWSGLGTSEAIYTLPATLPDTMTHQYLSLTYAITEVSGQGGIPEVLTQTLAGEYKGDKLNPNPSYHILDDFAGKVSGSVVENPNIVRHNNNGSQASLIPPLNFPSEFNQNSYNGIQVLDGNSMGVTNLTNSSISQQLFAFNLIEIVERKYGTISGSTTADKVTWLKANIASIVCNWWGYGSCPSGNKAYFTLWNPITNEWRSNSYNIANVPANCRWTTDEYVHASDLIDNNGFLFALAYTNASDGTTPSTIFTDYINIEVTLKTPSGYDVLAPENLRRDSGKSNILLVRKETKEIQLMFGSGDNLSGIVTYGNYNPKQGLLPPSSLVGGYSLVKPKAYLTTLTTRASNMLFSPNTNFDFLDEYLAIDSTISSALTDGSKLYPNNVYMCSMLELTKIIGNSHYYSPVDIGKITFINSGTLQLANNAWLIRFMDTTPFNINSQFVYLLSLLCKDINGILYLIICAANKALTEINMSNNTCRLLAFQLDKKPLIKGGN